MALPWRLRRWALYGGSAAFVVLLIALWFIWRLFFSTPPSCFDGKQNGGETGIDCGGPCALLCASQAYAPIVLWARAFPTSQQRHPAGVYVENNNAGAGARQVHYSFQLF